MIEGVHMKCKKCITIYLFILTILVALPFNVNAALDDGAWTSGPGATSGCDGKDSCWFFPGGAGQVTTAVRVSVVDLDGNVVKDSGGKRMIGDFASTQGIFNGLSGRKMYIYDFQNTPWAKTEYLNGHLGLYSNYWNMKAPYLNFVEYFSSWEDNASGFTAEWIENGAASNLLHNILTEYFHYTCFDRTSNKFSTSSTCNEQFFKEHFVMIEPVTAIRINGYGEFYGTQKELSFIYYYYNTHLTWAGSVIRKYMNYPFYLTSSIKEMYKDGIGYFNGGLLLSRKDYMNKHGGSCNTYSIKVECGSQGGNATYLVYPYQYATPKTCNVTKADQFYYSNGSASSCCTEVANNPTKYNFTSKQAFYESTVPSVNKTFKELCSPTPPVTTTVPKCDYSLKVTDEENCEKNITGTYSDTKDWQCIYDSVGATGDKISKYYFKSNSDTNKNATQIHSASKKVYCEVFCREDIKYDFPRIFDVLAGGYVTVNSQTGFEVIQPVKITGTSECKTKSINYEAFLQDYTNYNRQMQQNWDGWHSYQVRQNEVNSARQGDKDCAWSCDSWSSYESCSTDKDGNEHCHTHWTCDYGSYKGYTMYPPSGSYKYTNNSYASTITESSYCSTSRPSYYGTINSYQNAYNTAKVNRDEAVSNIYKCNNFQRTYSEFNPDLTLNMTELDKYQKSYELNYSDNTNSKSYYYNASNAVNAIRTWISNQTSGKKTTNAKNDFTNNSVALIGTSEKLVSYYSCTSGTSGLNLTGCNTADKWYPKNSSVTQTTEIIRTYKLQDNLYRFITKDGVSYTSDRRVSDNDIDLLYSNIPIAYSTLVGYKKFNLTYNTKLFGSNQNFYDYVLRSSKYYVIKNNSAYKKNGIYNCRYYVEGEFQETPDTPGGTPTNPTQPIDVTVIY